MQRLTLALTLVTLVAAPLGCAKQDKGTKNPDQDSKSDKDPLEELKDVPNQIQAEVDGVLKPITDVDVVIEQVSTMPGRLGVDAAGLRGLASASLTNGEVAINLDITAEAKAEVQAVLDTIKGIGVGLKETPKRATAATQNIVALGAKSAALVAKLTAKYQAKLSSPLTKAEEKLKIQAELDSVVKLDADIKAVVGDAKSTVMGLPAKGTEAMAKITAAFAGKAG
ncbi:MAG: hypothetical protein IAG13_32215 [Deltaproteobacteria bacterium]|nr:hypothetical protein [Nannocystaceae bacterium]